MSVLSEAIAHLFHPRLSNNHRAKILHPDGFLLLFLIITIASFSINRLTPLLGSNGGVLGYSSTITIQKVIEETNAERAKSGLPALVLNQQLNQAAEAKARDMFDEQYWAHYSPSGKSPWEFMKAAQYTYYVAGENLARDFLQTDDMMTAWMNSPTHRENIVNPKYQEIGIAVLDGVLNGSETTLVVQMFGSQLSAIGSSEVDNRAERIEIEQVPIPEIGDARQSPSFGLSNQAVLTPRSVLALSLEQITLPRHSPLLSPLHISKALFLAIIIMIVSVLLYDFVIVTNRKTVRFVGKNFGHIALFLTVSFLILFFKSGTIQ